MISVISPTVPLRAGPRDWWYVLFFVVEGERCYLRVRYVSLEAAVRAARAFGGRCHYVCASTTLLPF